MPRPKTSEGFKPSLETRRKLARCAGRYYKHIKESYPEDFKQQVELITLTQLNKHLVKQWIEGMKKK